MKVKSESEVAQSCPTLSDPMDCSLRGSSVHGIFQARVLEWGAIAFSAFIFYSNPNHKAYMRQSVNFRIMETILRCIKQIRNLWAILVALWLLTNFNCIKNRGVGLRSGRGGSGERGHLNIYTHTHTRTYGWLILYVRNQYNIIKQLSSIWGFPCSSVGQESACSAGDLGSIPGLGRSPGEGNGNPLQYPCLEKSHGQRSLVGCSPWDRREQLSN